MLAVELVVAAAVAHPEGVVVLLAVVAAVVRSAVDAVAAVASRVVEDAVDAVASPPVGEADTKRIPDRFTFAMKTPGRAVFPSRGMTLDITDTNGYHEHSTAFGSSMGFLVHVEHGAILEKALEHVVRMIVISAESKLQKHARNAGRAATLSRDYMPCSIPAPQLPQASWRLQRNTGGAKDLVVTAGYLSPRVMTTRLTCRIWSLTVAPDFMLQRLRLNLC